MAAARLVYDGLRDAATSQLLAVGLAKGSELLWGQPFPADGPRPPIVSVMRSLIFESPVWDWRAFEFSRPADHDKVVSRERLLSPILNADDPDLRPFRASGGKILQFNGWADQAVVAASSAAYYDNVARLLGSTGDPGRARLEVQRFYRLFLVPGMTHGLGNGFGPATFDLLSALEDWVERGKAPDSLVAEEFDETGTVVRSRPLCSYPTLARYRGSGDVNQASSFSCSE